LAQRGQRLLCRGAKSVAIAPHDAFCFDILSFELRIVLFRLEFFSLPLPRPLFEQFFKADGSPGLGLRNPLICFMRCAVIGISTSLPFSSIQLSCVPALIPSRLRNSTGIVT
jgi:hypothetical protein